MDIPYMFYADKNQSEVQGILFHIAAQTLEDLASIFKHFLEDSTGNTQVFLGSCPLLAAQDDLSILDGQSIRGPRGTGIRAAACSRRLEQTKLPTAPLLLDELRFIIIHISACTKASLGLLALAFLVLVCLPCVLDVARFVGDFNEIATSQPRFEPFLCQIKFPHQQGLAQGLLALGTLAGGVSFLQTKFTQAVKLLTKILAEKQHEQCPSSPETSASLC